MLLAVLEQREPHQSVLQRNSGHKFTLNSPCSQRGIGHEEGTASWHSPRSIAQGRHLCHLCSHINSVPSIMQCLRSCLTLPREVSGGSGGKRHGDAHCHPPKPRGHLRGSPHISFPLNRPSSNTEIPETALLAFFLLKTQPCGGRRPAARTAVGSHRAARTLLPAGILGSRRGCAALPAAGWQGKGLRLRRPHSITEQPW